MAEALEKQTEKPKATKPKVSYKTRYDGRAKKRHWVEFTPRSEEEEIKRAANTEPFERIKRKKCCLLMSYSGVNYFGMQRFVNNVIIIRKKKIIIEINSCILEIPKRKLLKKIY